MKPPRFASALLALVCLSALESCFLMRPVRREPEPMLMESGLVIWELLRAEGPTAESGDTVQIHYIVRLLDGTQIDSSRDRDTPVQIVIDKSQVMQGLHQGLTGMSKNSMRRLQIPPELGYGENGAGPVPPNSTLLIELEIMELEKSPDNLPLASDAH